MTTEIQAPEDGHTAVMRQALEALENSSPHNNGAGWIKKHHAAKRALQDALAAQPATVKQDLTVAAPAEGDEPAYLAQGDMQSAAYPAGLVRSWTEHNRERYTVKLYTRPADTQPKGIPFLARDVAELLGIGVPELSVALVALGFPQRSQGMTIDPLEALAVCRARAAQAPAPAPHVPAGMALVPVDPTDAMRISGGIALESSPAHDVIGPLVDAWAAMLAAAPTVALAAAQAPAPVAGPLTAHECDRLLKSVRYMQGIAERGEERQMSDDETVEEFVLGYVKRLEAAQAPAVGADDARDAARYRFIRDADRSDSFITHDELLSLSMEDLDRAIDTAMKQEAQQ